MKNEQGKSVSQHVVPSQMQYVGFNENPHENQHAASSIWLGFSKSSKHLKYSSLLRQCSDDCLTRIIFKTELIMKIILATALTMVLPLVEMLFSNAADFKDDIRIY